MTYENNPINNWANNNINILKLKSPVSYKDTSKKSE